MGPANDERYQKRYFDIAENQYPPSEILEPPLHTELEMQLVLDRLKGLRIDTPVIDFGSGTGRLSLALARAGYSVLAVDVSDGSLDVLSTIAREMRVPPIRTESALPRDERFSAIVGADVLHHVDMNDYLPKIHDSLCPGGKAIFSEPGALNPSWYVYLSLFHEVRVEKRIVTCNVLTLRRRFEQQGFRDVRITGLGLLPRPFFRSSARLCRRHDAMGNWPVLKWFAYRYVIEATKHGPIEPGRL